MVSWPHGVPGPPDPGTGQEASARGTHLGRAAEARGGEGGRGSRHVASSDCLLLSVNPGWGRGSEGPRKTFFQAALGAAKLFVAALLWLPAVGSQRGGSSALGGTALGGDPSLSAGTVGAAPVAPRSCLRRLGARHRGAGAGSPRPLPCARPAPPSPPAGMGAGRLPASPPLRPPRRQQLSRLAATRRRGRRGPHKGRRGRQVGRAPGAGRAAESESDRAQPAASRLVGSPRPRGRVNTPTPHPLPEGEVTGAFRVYRERVAREEVECFVLFPLALWEYREVADFFSLGSDFPPTRPPATHSAPLT